MAPASTAVAAKPVADITEHVNPRQALLAATALLRKIGSDQTTRKATAEKTDLLADADEEKEDDKTPVWLILTTKKHIIDQQRLKPGKILLPHPYLNTSDPTLRICLITADPQRQYKDLVAHPSFPLDVSSRIARVVGITKLKAKYKSYESRRQLLGEYDIFLADDRIITQLPAALGKVFYKSGSKRPLPISLQGRSQNFDDQGNKRRKLAEGGTKVTKSEAKPADVAHEIERALSCAPVHLAPSTTTAIKVGTSGFEPNQLQENIETVVAQMVERYVPQKWSNLRAIHIKGPETVALPIYVAEELWQDEKDVLEEPLPIKVAKKNKKKRGLASLTEGEPTADEVIEVPGPDGKMRRLEKPGKKSATESQEQQLARATEKAEKAARREALKEQKEATKATRASAKTEAKTNGAAKKVRPTRAKASDLI